MLDLIKLWANIQVHNQKTELSQQSYPEGTHEKVIAFEKNTVQSSFEFTNSPNVIFVKSISTLEPVDFYDDLPEIPMSVDENNIRLVIVSEKMKANELRIQEQKQDGKQTTIPKFYDGDHILITNIAYVESSNTVFVEAKQAKYSFLLALSTKRFPSSSPLYKLEFFKTGVLVNILTKNGFSTLHQRSTDTLYSVPGGFLEPSEDRRLNFQDGSNFVTRTAVNELIDEIAGIKGKQELRFEFTMPQVTAISIRKTADNPIGTIEFIAPTRANCHSSYLEQVIKTNAAKDANEHTSNYVLLPVDSNYRDELVKKLLGPKKIPGSCLHLPGILSLTNQENKDSCMIGLPRAIPLNLSNVYPLRMFKAEPNNSLYMKDEENYSEEFKPA